MGSPSTDAETGWGDTSRPRHTTTCHTSHVSSTFSGARQFATQHHAAFQAVVACPHAGQGIRPTTRAQFGEEAKLPALMPSTGTSKGATMAACAQQWFVAAEGN
jgi:hypothetical protein